MQLFFSKNIHDIVIIFAVAVDFKQLSPKDNQRVSSGDEV